MEKDELWEPIYGFKDTLLPIFTILASVDFN